MSNPEAQDLITSIERYRRLLGQLDLPFPRDFPLMALLQEHHEGMQLLERVQLIQGAGGAATETRPADQPAGDATIPPADAPTSDPPATDSPAETDKPAETNKPAEPAAETPAADNPTNADEAPVGDRKPAGDGAPQSGGAAD